MPVSAHALVVAAGRASRFGGQIPKQYMPLLGRPVLARSIAALFGAPGIRAVTVVLAPDDQWFGDLVAPAYPRVKTVAGGETRAESVLNGLNAIGDIDPEASWVLVHDAARPCLDPARLAALLDAVRDHQDGAILAMPVSDSLKRADENLAISSDVERAGLWAAQTPQLFPIDRLVAALQKMMDAQSYPGDEASAMQFSGARPRLVRGSADNIKITWPSDIALAEAILGLRKTSGGV